MITSFHPLVTLGDFRPWVGETFKRQVFNFSTGGGPSSRGKIQGFGESPLRGLVGLLKKGFWGTLQKGWERGYKTGGIYLRVFQKSNLGRLYLGGHRNFFSKKPGGKNPKRGEFSPPTMKEWSRALIFPAVEKERRVKIRG